ncbi:MAG: hypothetical protein KGJ02_04365 [Verrucomicrobiota bacterium]|nr:hypothetical protein [Verrucomicrobiota bacterium]
MSEKSVLKFYGILGKILCGVAGGIVGLLIEGPWSIALGTSLGILSGHLIERRISHIAVDKE